MPAMRRLVTGLAILATAVTSSMAAHGAEPNGVDVVVVTGPLDSRLISFVTGAIEGSTAQLVVLQLDVVAVLDPGVDRLISLVADPPVPLAVWVGPERAVAHGGAAVLVAAAPVRGAAPGARIGWASPMVAGGEQDAEAISALRPDFPEEGLSGRIRVTDPVPGLVDVVQPAIGQFIASLHGTEVNVRGRTVTLDTARVDVEDGVEVIRTSAAVRFIEPGLLDRVLRLSTRPEAAFFLLLLGLALVTLEFFAAGPGVAAVAGAAALLLAGYGLSVLPVWWPALLAVFAGVALYVVELQRNDLGWKSVAGTALLIGGGLWLVDGAPQLAPTWWVVLLVVLGAALFFVMALTTVARARFATQTIGRQHLVGRVGVARGPIAPDGLVEVDGARWKARTARSAAIPSGGRVTVVSVDGVVLRVEPVE